MGRLQETGIVGKSGRSFYIRDRLLRYWLRYVFRRRRDAMDIDPARFLEEFQAAFAAAVEDFRIQIKKDMPVRIMELFHCFDDEAIHMDGRRYKLPVFDNISLEKMKFAAAAGFHLLRASAGADEWLILLKPEQVKEQDLSQIIAEVKKEYVRPQRCVLISMHDLDETARVRALQERMWIWNERELRTLFNIYNKPYLVV